MYVGQEEAEKVTGEGEEEGEEEEEELWTAAADAGGPRTVLGCSLRRDKDLLRGARLNDVGCRAATPGCCWCCRT